MLASNCLLFYKNYNTNLPANSYNVLHFFFFYKQCRSVSAGVKAKGTIY